MVEAYSVSVSLLLGGNVPPTLARISEQFETLDKLIGRVQGSVDRLASSMTSLARMGDAAASSWTRAADAIERAAGRVAAATGGGRGGPRLLLGNGTGGAFGGGGGPLLLTGPGGGGGTGGGAGGGGAGGGGAGTGGGTGGGGGGRGPIPLNYRAPAPLNPVAAGVAAGVGFDVMRGFIERAIDADSVIALMRAQARFSDADVDQSQALARKLVTSVPGMGYEEGLKLILQTASFTGNTQEALDLTPTLARDAQILSLFGKGDAVGQVESAIKAGELTGLTTKDGKIDLPKLEAFVNGLTNTFVAGGGTMDINQYLTSIRQFGAGADAATTDFLLNVLPAYQKIMGASKAGTALASMQQSMLSTRPNTQNKSIIEEQERLGLRDKKTGHLSEEDARLLSSDPNAYFVTRLMPALFAHGYRDAAAIRGELSKFLPRATMERLAAANIFDQGIIDKEANSNRQQQAAGGPLGDRLLLESPANQMLAFEESFHLLQISFGDAAMKPFLAGVRSLSDIMISIGAWAKANPDGARMAMEGLAGGIAALGGAAVIGALGKLGGKTGLLAGLGFGIGALGSGLDKLPKWIMGAIAGGSVAGLPGAVAGAMGFGLPDMGGWIDKNVPGASALDDWVAHHTGGAAGLTFEQQKKLGYLPDDSTGKYSPPRAPAPAAPLPGGPGGVFPGGTYQKDSFKLDPDQMNELATNIRDAVAKQTGTAANPGYVILLNASDLGRAMIGGISNAVNRLPAGPTGHSIQTTPPWGATSVA